MSVRVAAVASLVVFQSSKRALLPMNFRFFGFVLLPDEKGGISCQSWAADHRVMSAAIDPTIVSFTPCLP